MVVFGPPFYQVVGGRMEEVHTGPRYFMAVLSSGVTYVRAKREVMEFL